MTKDNIYTCARCKYKFTKSRGTGFSQMNQDLTTINFCSLECLCKEKFNTSPTKIRRALISFINVVG